MLDLPAIIKALANFFQKIIVSLPKLVIGWILTWRYQQEYLRAIERKFNELTRSYTPLEVWAIPASSGKLSLREMGQSIGFLIDHVDKYSRAVLVGEAGSGKSTTLYRIAQDCASQARSGQSKYIPIMASLSNLKESSLTGILNLLQISIGLYERRSWLERQDIHWGKKTSERVENLLEDGRAIVLLDGMNEIDSELQNTAFDALEEFTQMPKYSESRMILAARASTHSAQRLTECDQLSLLPFNDTSMHAFLIARGINADAVLRRLTNMNLKDICRNPYIFEMFADLYKRPNVDLPPNRGQVLRRYVDALFQDGQPKWSSTFSWRWVERDSMIEILGKLAFDMISQNQLRIPVDKAEHIIAQIGKLQQSIEPRDVLEEANFCLLMDFLADQTEIRFKHDLIRSYFAAEYLEAQWRMGASIALNELVAGEHWWEPQLVQAGIAAHPLKFVQSLAETEPSEKAGFLALGCLLSASAENIAEEDSQEHQDLLYHLSHQVIEQFQTTSNLLELGRISVRLANWVGNTYLDTLGQLLDPALTAEQDIRLYGVNLLCEIHIERAIDLLITGLSDPVNEISMAATRGLLDCVQDIGLTDQQLQRVISLLSNDTAYRNALKILLICKHSSKVANLVAILSSEEESHVRATLRYLLYRLGEYVAALEITKPLNTVDERFVVAFCTYWIRSEERNSLIALIPAIEGANQRRCFEPLIDLARTTDMDLVTNALNGLQSIQDHDALPLLTDVGANLNNPINVRLIAIQSTFSIDKKAALPFLVGLLADSDWRIQSLASDLLSEAGRESVTFLLPLLKVERADLRRYVARLLGSIGDRRAVTALLELAADDEWSVRAAIAWSFGRISDEAAIPALEILSKDTNRFVKQEAVRSLEAVKSYRYVTPTVSTSTAGGLYTSLSSYITGLATQERPNWLVRLVLRVQGKDIHLWAQITGNSSFFIFRAMALIAKGEYLQAVADLSSILALDKDNILARLCRALAFTGANRYEDALADCDEVIAQQADIPIAYTLHARIHRMLFHPDLALKSAQTAVALEPNSVVAANELGCAHTLRFNFREAEFQFHRALELNSRSADAHYGLASISFLELRLDDALNHIDTAIELAPNSGVNYYFRYSLLILANMPDVAHFDLTALSEVEPNSEEYHLALGIYQLLQGDPEEALLNVETALRINPYSLMALMLRVCGLLLSNKYEDLISESDHILRLYPQNYLIYIYRSLALLLTDKPGLALDDLNKVAGEAHDFGLLYLMRANMYELLGQLDLMYQDLDKTADMMPFSGFVRLYRGGIHVKYGDLEKAMQDFNQAVELSPSNWAYLIVRARAYIRLREFESAQRDLRSAEKLHADIVSVLDGWASLHIIRSQYDAAIIVLEEIDRINPDQVATGLKRSLIRLIKNETEIAVQGYTEYLARATSLEVDIAEADLISEPTLSDAQRQLAQAIIKPFADDLSFPLGNLKSELISFATFLK